ncbi:uncharacterized protein BJ171DRAFT_120480 [Polychytrium aggregatum]|uniref:uncharacterized protein n=1 Tax=Polychytrium aggregatum TaxID=110093 RepID=UPI0022FDC81E|nr:uncharacterized protein BJ171DRAFT_120480 [Polychytrium aggregatum]KAI9204186.1 hypothetical protein BJ171DRAFT_120480 [Polychytrium aggregatum]
MRDALGRLCQRQIADIDPENIFSIVYNLLDAIDPAAGASMDPIKLSMGRLYIPSDLLLQSETLLKIESSIVNQGVTIISAMGGMGKSVLARQFVHNAVKTQCAYSNVFWVTCSSVEAATDDLLSIEEFEGVAHKDILGHASKFFEAQKRYLLVIDNVDDIEVTNQVFAKLKRFGGDVLITTRYETLPPGKLQRALEMTSGSRKQSILSLEVWDTSKTKGYILSRCDSLHTAVSTPADKVHFESLLSIINGYPIVVEQFISYYEARQPPLSVVVTDFSKILSHQGSNESDDDDPSKTCLRALVEWALRWLNEKHTSFASTAVKLCGAVGYLDSSWIQFRLLESLIKRFDPTCERPPDVIYAMQQVGLLRRRSGDSYYTHGLVQQVSRDLCTSGNSMQEYGLADVVRSTAEVLCEVVGSFPFSKSALEIGIHLQAFASVTSPKQYDQEYQVKIDLINADLAYSRGLLRVSNQILVQAIEKMEIFYGTRTQPLVAQAYHQLGIVVEAQAKYTDAIQHFQTALAIRVEYYGTREHSSIADNLNQLGMVTRKVASIQQAKVYHQEAIEIAAKLPEAEGREVESGAHYAMGGIDMAEGRYNDAFSHYSKVLEAEVLKYGTRSHPYVAGTLHALGGVSLAMEKYSDARAYHQEALEIKIASYNTRKHTYVATSLHALGDVAIAEGKLDEALTYYREALDIRVAGFGTREHSGVAATILQIGRVAEAKGDYEVAAAKFREALELQRTIHAGRPHNSILHSLLQLGSATRSMGKYEDARAHYENALDMRMGMMPNSSPESVLGLLYELGCTCILCGDNQSAKKYLEEYVARIVQCAEIDVARTSLKEVYLKLARIETNDKNYTKAKVYAQNAINIQSKNGRVHREATELLAELKVTEQE